MKGRILRRAALSTALRVFLAWLLVCQAMPLRSDELTTLTSTRDATINQGAPTTNNGTGTTLSTHTATGKNQRSLVRFDFSTTTLSSTTAVKTSTLHLIPTQPLFSSRNQETHRITGSTDWTETGVTWNTRDGVTAWGTPGGDFDPTATATQPSGTTSGTAVNFNVLSDSTSTNIPQAWINGTIPNYGLLVKDQAEDGSAFQYVRALTVTVGANAPFNGYNGYTAQLTGLNTATLITAGKMQSNCNDLRVARFAANTWTELDRQIVNCNTASTSIWFKLQADIVASGSDTSYSIFYGNSSATAGPANLNNVYLFYDDFESDTVGSVPAGWTVQAGGPWTVVLDGATNHILREGNTGAAARNIIHVTSITNERDVYQQASVRMQSAVGKESTGCLQGRVGGTGSGDVTGYRSCLQYLLQKQTQLAYWLNGTFTNLQQVAFAWTDNTYYTLGGAFFGSPATLRNYVNGVLQQSVTGDTNIPGAGSVGPFVWNGDPVNYDYDNYLVRRYTEPEPTVTIGAETNPATPLYGSREDVAANRPTLDVHYLRDVTLNAATPGISEITVNWAFPTGSTSANYDGVLFGRQQGAVAPSFAPADGTTYVVGAQPSANQYIAANSSAFTTVSALDENGDNSVILPGTQYTYKAYTHDATTITGAASSVPPHYSFGSTATQSVTTGTGGGANKNWSYKTGATTLAAPGVDPGSTVVTGGNDNLIHAMSAVTGARDYQPGGTSGVTGGATQSRLSVIAGSDTSNTTCHNTCDVTYVASGDGTVYAFRTDTGAQLWQTGVLTTGAGSGFQAAAVVELKSYAGSGYTLGFDLVVVATRNVGAGSTTNNKVYGLNGNTGATVWTANTGNLDIVNGTPYIDYGNNAVWVTSRSNGNTQASVWKINSINGTVLASFNLNDVDQPPTQNGDGRVIYVLANNGTVTAVRTDLANCTTNLTLAGVVPVGFAIPFATAAFNDDVYFSASNSVRKLHFAYAASCTGTFTQSPGGWVNPTITSPSSLIFTYPPLTLYVGSSTGLLYKINSTTGGIAATRTVNAGSTIGDPTVDTYLQKFYVGDASGHIYSFDVF